MDRSLRTTHGCRSEVEGDGRGTAIPCAGAAVNHGLGEIPIGSPAAGAHHVVQPAWEIVREFHPLAPHRTRAGRTRPDVADPPILAVFELTSRAIRITDFENRRTHARRRPCHITERGRRSARHCNAERCCGDIGEKWRTAAGLRLRHEGAIGSLAERVERVIRASDHRRDGEVSIRIRVHPELIGLHPLLEIISARRCHRLPDEADPQVRRSGVRILAVVDDDLSRHRAAAGGSGVVGVREPTVGPRACLGRALGQGVVVKRLRRLHRVRDGLGNVVAIDKIRTADFPPRFTCDKITVGSHLVMVAIEHVQDRRADVAHQFRMQRAAVVILRGGQHVPESDIFPARANAAPAPHALVAPVRAVFVFVLVASLIDSVGPQRAFHRGGGHSDGRAAGDLHQLVAGGIHTHPVENRARVNVVAALAHAECTVRAIVRPDRRNIKARRAPAHRVDHGKRHVRLGRGRYRDFRVVAAVGGGIRDDGVVGENQSLVVAVLPIQLAAVGISREQVERLAGSGVVEGVIDRRDLRARFRHRDGNDPVAHRRRGARAGQRDVRAGAGAAAGDVSKNWKRRQQPGEQNDESVKMMFWHGWIHGWMATR